MLHFNTINDIRKASGLPLPEHPLISVIAGLKTCPFGGREFTTNCYMIAYKKFIAGVMLYGRTSYDHSNGCLSFIKPRQVMQFDNLELEEDNFIICIHEDFLTGHHLFHDIQKYHYFEYEVNEALHLSPREEKTIWELYHKIAAEYNNNLDEYSQDIMLTHIDSILKYALRYYRRQFINRSINSGKTVSKFNEVLSTYFQDGELKNKRLPSVTQMAEKLNMSRRYLSDLLKQETGKTAIELIHLSLINEAKNRLRVKDQNISEIAFQLGFDNLSYFSKLFRKETGVSPTEFKKQLLD
jgi:AraC family transcriptional regulator, transcriptional activator of pobA